MIKQKPRTVQKARRLSYLIALLSLMPQGTETLLADGLSDSPRPDATIVGVVDGPGGNGYWVVSADGSVEVVGTRIVPPMGASEPITDRVRSCLLYTSPSPRDRTRSRMPSSA